MKNNVFKSALTLILIFAVFAGLLFGVNLFAAPLIAANDNAAELAPLFAVMPEAKGFELIYSAEDPAAPDYFDERYSVRLEDESFGEVSIYYEQALDCCAVRAAFKKPGQTRLILTSPDGSALAWPLTVSKDSYERGEPVPWTGR